MGDFMVPVSQNEQSGEIINTNPSQTGHTTLPLPERVQNQSLWNATVSTAEFSNSRRHFWFNSELFMIIHEFIATITSN